MRRAMNNFVRTWFVLIVEEKNITTGGLYANNTIINRSQTGYLSRYK